MSVRVVAASPDEASLLSSLGQLYAHDFSELVPMELNAAGRFDHDFLQGCWSDGTQTPYLIYAGDHLAGFAIVGRGSRLTDDPSVHDVSEFFIVRRYRRQGIGTRAAAVLFGLRRGVWEVRELVGNAAARAFWQRAISAYSGGRFEEFVVEDDRWHGWVQRFVS